MHPAYVIEAAKAADVRQLMDLNTYWAKRFSARNLADGFLSGVPFTESEWIQICGSGDVFVARSSGQIVGYYLIDELATSEAAKLYDEIRKKLVIRGTVPARGVARRTQTVVADAHHGRGISRLLLGALLERIALRYEFLMGLVHEQNPKLPAHRAIGWQVVDYHYPFHVVLLQTSATSLALKG
jgi:GNAT superfamily N-acetyltransferase